MKDITILFEKAVNYNSENIHSFEKELMKISSAIHVKIDWDYGVPEEWARLLFKDDLVGLVCRQISIIFISKSFYDNLKKISNFVIETVDEFDKKEWSIDVQKYNSIMPSMPWLVSAEVLNPDKFSLLDFYWATVS